MTIWDWCDEYERQARARGDEDAVRLSRLHYEAYNFRETNPGRTILLLEEVADGPLPVEQDATLGLGDRLARTGGVPACTRLPTSEPSSVCRKNP